MPTLEELGSMPLAEKMKLAEKLTALSKRKTETLGTKIIMAVPEELAEEIADALLELLTLAKEHGRLEMILERLDDENQTDGREVANSALAEELK